MRMSRAPRPYRVDEFIVDVLLRILDNTLNVARGVIDELPESDRVVQGQIVVIGSDRCVQVVHKQLDDSSLFRFSGGAPAPSAATGG